MERISTVKTTRELLEKYDLSAKKKYGQNFLVNENVVDRIVAAAEGSRLVIEIGPGLGSVTQQLLKYCDRVIAYEIDEDMVKVIRENLPEADIRNQDFLKADLTEFSNEKACVVSNLPYYITTDIMVKIFRELDFSKLIVMVQKEVAERFLHPDDKKDYNPLKVLIDLYCNSSLLLNVDRHEFWPSPNVDSSVIVLERNDKNVDADFIQFVQDCFSQRRKMVLSNLKKAVYPVSEEVFERAGLSEKARVEQISPDQFYRLYLEVKS